MSLQLQNNRKAATGSRRWFSKTLIAAYVVLGLVLWQTIHVIGGGEIPFLQSRKPQMGSTKLHMDRDAMSRKSRPTKEPVAAFFERAKRGMTEQEIRGMIVDFEAIWEMPISGEIAELLDYGGRLNDWYSRSLAEALSLTPEQKRIVSDSLAEKLEQKIEEYKRHNLSGISKEALGVMTLVDYSVNLHPRTNADLWSVCVLTEAQIELTYRKSVEIEQVKLAEENRVNMMNSNSDSIRCHLPIFLMMHDPVSGELIDYPPPSDLNLVSSVDGMTNGGIIDISNTFPLTPDQKLVDHRNDILAQAKLLHPAQLRMALLMNPKVAELIKIEMNAVQVRE